MLIKNIMTLVLATFGTTFCFAQINKNALQNSNAFNPGGKWELIEIDGTKISANPKSSFANITLNITAKDAEIRIERNKSNSTTEQFIYYSDGRGESNITFPLAVTTPGKARFFYTSAPPKSYESKTFLKNGKLTT